MGGAPTGGAQLLPLTFDDLAGWREDDHAAALVAFQAGAAVLERHPPKTRFLATDATALAAILARAAEMQGPSPGEARDFFEAAFVPFEVVPVEGAAFFTGYYEPAVAGSRTRTGDFAVPLLAPPPELVEIDPGSAPNLDPSFRYALKADAGYVECPDRGAIAAGALAGRNLELVWLVDPVDIFFIHIQGAARIRLSDGGTMRVTYAAKSGHPYTPIGRVLIETGALTKEEATMQGIRAWLAAHPDKAEAVMARNRSYIFFREAPATDDRLGPIAAARVPLTAMRSLAVDRLQHTFHSPVWVETTLPDGAPFRHLTIAQDTGSAIVGAARGDIFFGSGAAAGEIAGGMRAGGRFVLLMPKGAP
jgi:membrane-bound lytic murein transglycosylase A